MLIEDDAHMLPLEQFGEQCFAFLDRLAAQIAAVELKQIERAKDGTSECAVAADQIKNGKSVLVTDDSLAINQARANRELANGRSDEGKPRREIVSGAGNQSHTRCTFAGHDAKAVMLDFVNPAGARRRGFGRRGQTRLDNAQIGAGTLTQRHGHLIRTTAERVETKKPGPKRRSGVSASGRYAC